MTLFDIKNVDARDKPGHFGLKDPIAPPYDAASEFSTSLIQ
jgi:hypothetical protein